MIKIEKDEVMGWEHAIRGMRNPMNSWEKSDSNFIDWWNPEKDTITMHDIFLTTKDCLWDDDLEELGPNDHGLMMGLAKAGTEHSKYRRMIVCYVDITAPLYWWKEFDTYKVGTVANSCSTMHKIHAKEFTLEDFSHEHLIDISDIPHPLDDCVVYDMMDLDRGPVLEVREGYALTMLSSDGTALAAPSGILMCAIDMLNRCRELYLETNDKRYWWQMIQLLPSSYNQKRTVMMNYENLAAIYRQRKDHKLDEWHTFCDWIKTLPYSEIITLEE